MVKSHWMLWPVTLALTACINLGPNKGAPMHDYQLGNGDAPVPTLSLKACTISIQEGWVAPAYRGNAMAYQTRPYQMDYFALNRWQFPPLSMMSGGLAQALQTSGGFKAVMVSPPYVGQVDRVVHINLLQLSQVFDEQHAAVKERLKLQLVMTMGLSQAVVSQQIFAIDVPVQASPLGGVQGANQAWQQLLPAMTSYVYRGCA